MHDSIMAQVGMENEHHNGHENGYGSNEGWGEINHNYNNSQHQSPMYEHGGFGYMQPIQHSLPEASSFNSPRMPLPSTSAHTLVPLIMPSNPTWPSMLTNPASYPTPPLVIPQASPPVIKGNATKLPAIHGMSSPRKTLTDNDRRRMCQYHEDNPSVKQTEIGAMFGVERSTVSKVLRQKEKYLYPEDRGESPAKRIKGKLQVPDIERALANWARNQNKSGIPLSDASIKEKAKFFSATVGNNENPLKINSSSWLEKFKQKNGIGGGKLTRRASETNISDSGSLNPESRTPSASQTPNGISPTSPNILPSLSPLSGAKSDDELKPGSLNSYFDFGQSGVYKHSNSHSTASLSSNFTDNTPSYSAGPTSPTTSFTFSSETNSGAWLPPQHGRLPTVGNSFQRPRSQTFPMLGIDPSFISGQTTEPLTPKYSLSATAPSSAIDSPNHEMPPFAMDSAISSPLRHSSSNGSMAPPSGTPLTGLQSPPGSSAPSSPTQDDARRALDTLLNFIKQAPSGLVDQTEYMTVIKLTEKLRLQTSTILPGGLHRIAEQENESLIKIEQSNNNTNC